MGGKEQQTLYIFYGATSLEQQSADTHVAPFSHIIQIPNQPDFALSTYGCVLLGSNEYLMLKYKKELSFLVCT
jgi:hypothetical protein